MQEQLLANLAGVSCTAMLNIPCPWCDVPMQYDHAHAGQQVACFACGKAFKMPDQVPKPAKVKPREQPQYGAAPIASAGSPQEWTALRFVSSLCRISGVLTWVVGAFLALVALVQYGYLAGMLVGLDAYVVGMITLAMGEGIMVFIRIEENTRPRA